MLTWDELAARSLARQFPDVDGVDGVAGLVGTIGPIQSQAARAPFLGLLARDPALTGEAISAAYDDGTLVRGSTIRGTVHTSTPRQHVLLDATTRVGQHTLWQRLIKPSTLTLEELWDRMEAYTAPAWRTPEELAAHLRHVLFDAGEHEAVERIDNQQGRYLAFGQGAFVRRPVNGDWRGQGKAVYRLASAVHGLSRPESLDEAVLMHVRAHGPVSRNDIAWWSGLGLRVVDDVLDRLDLVAERGPMERAYVDVADAPSPRPLPGVRLLPEFDALLCGYDSKARDRFVDPDHHATLWASANGLVLPPLLVDGRITGHWRLAGTGRQRDLEVTCFRRTRKPRLAELEQPAAGVAEALGVAIGRVRCERA